MCVSITLVTECYLVSRRVSLMHGVRCADCEAVHAEEQGMDGKGPRTSLY